MNIPKCPRPPMSVLTMGLLLLALLLTGCSDKKPAAKEEPLVPNAEERHTLRAYQLDPDSQRGQHKIRQMRKNREKIKEIRENYQELAEKQRQRQEAQEGESDSVNVIDNRIDRVLRGE